MSRFHTSLPSIVRQANFTFPVTIQTYLPSVIGEGDAEFCLRKIWFPLSISFRQRMEPSLRLTARRKILSGGLVPGFRSPRRRDPSSAEVTKIVSFQMIGVAALQLGSFVRQSTFSVSVH